MILDRVTITGADDSVQPLDLLKLSERFPFVEWGILVSGSKQGGARFPSQEWMDNLRLFAQGVPDNELRLSMHVCGRWVRDICNGVFTTLLTELLPNDLGFNFYERCQRIQLNFHAYAHAVSEPAFSDGLRRMCSGHQVIFQCDGVNDHLASHARDDGINAVPLYDKSGGAGVIPAEWPKPMTGIYSGYAGGLAPHNVADELKHRISLVCREDDRIWIDCETHVRSDSDRTFDLAKVRAFLEAAEEHVTQEASK